jgi:hypothetical protein
VSQVAPQRVPKIDLRLDSASLAFFARLLVLKPLDFVRFSAVIAVAQKAIFGYNLAYFFRLRSR